MPYIPKIHREQAKKVGAIDAGELNFLLTEVCLDYIHRQGRKYSTFNDIIGALECAKQEFYRRLAAPYEDVKIKENGDVY